MFLGSSLRKVQPFGFVVAIPAFDKYALLSAQPSDSSVRTVHLIRGRNITLGARPATWPCNMDLQLRA